MQPYCIVLFVYFKMVKVYFLKLLMVDDLMNFDGWIKNDPDLKHLLEQ